MKLNEKREEKSLKEYQQFQKKICLNLILSDRPNITTKKNILNIKINIFKNKKKREGRIILRAQSLINSSKPEIKKNTKT